MNFPAPCTCYCPACAQTPASGLMFLFGEMPLLFPTQLQSSFSLFWKPQSHLSFWAQLTFGKPPTRAP